jgi:sigma-B regulation protein RsbU (phosphoserine phosphatase)
MAMCSSLIRTYAIRFPTLPALALSSVNERIFTDMRGGLFLTAFYGILEPQTGRLRYVNAGHKPPILIGDIKGKAVEELKSTGMALGVSEEATWEQEMITFSPGDALVMYTDGIFKAHNNEGDYFSESGLQSAISRLRGKTASETLVVILDEINSFTAGAPGQDDMALIVLSRKP